MRKNPPLPAARSASVKKSAKTRRTGTGVHGRFLQELASGSIQPGDRLGEPTLAARWKVSRPQVRDALIRLECEGLVERRPQSGTYVREYSRDEVAELYRLRAMLEGFVARKLVEVVSDRELDELEKLAFEADNCDATTGSEETFRRESRFHLRLCELARMPHVMSVINMRHLLLTTLYMTSQNEPSPLVEHRRLVEILRTRDADLCEKFAQEIMLTSCDELLAVHDKKETKTSRKAPARRASVTKK